METFGNAIKLKQQPSFFNPKGIVSQQRFTTSKDGTRIPYFIIGKNLNDTKPKRYFIHVELYQVKDSVQKEFGCERQLGKSITQYDNSVCFGNKLEFLILLMIRNRFHTILSQ